MGAASHQVRRRASRSSSVRDVRDAHRLAVLRELYAAGAVTRRDLAVRVGISVAINARRGTLVGVEVRATSVHIDVYDLSLQPRTRMVVPPTRWRDLGHAVSTALAHAGIDTDRVLGVGVAAPAALRGERLDPLVLQAPVYVSEPATAAAAPSCGSGPTATRPTWSASRWPTAPTPPS